VLLEDLLTLITVSRETILSFIYISQAVKIMRYSQKQGTKAMLRQLLWINAFIIAMDIGLLSVEYASLFWLEVVLKGLLYSIKLKLEFAILNRLVAFTKGRPCVDSSLTIPEDLEHRIPTSESTPNLSNDSYTAGIWSLGSSSVVKPDVVHIERYNPDPVQTDSTRR
jgi:hypothetical protein